VHHGSDQVFFGATVTYAEDSGTQRTITILGIDEADSLQGQVSWISPIARTLLKSRVGDELKLHTPAGVLNIEVIEVSYPPASEA
jgi:transcription elongation factor GreB